MKVLKIEHAGKTADGAKIAISLSSDKSIGVILKPGEFILSQDQNTASLDSQKRRGFVNVSEFDNFEYNLDLGKVYTNSILVKPIQEEEISTPVDKLSEAEQDATDYINTQD
jgi:hypothetical protein